MHWGLTCLATLLWFSHLHLTTADSSQFKMFISSEISGPLTDCLIFIEPKFAIGFVVFELLLLLSVLGVFCIRILVLNIKVNKLK